MVGRCMDCKEVVYIYSHGHRRMRSDRDGISQERAKLNHAHAGAQYGMEHYAEKQTYAPHEVVE